VRYYIGFLLVIFSSHSYPQDKESLLTAWENIQKNSTQVESFEKTDKGRYNIKFSTLPFEGKLVVLGSDTEDIAYGGTNKAYTKAGYLEIDLVGAPDNLMNKYSRSYYKWTASNTLYFNNETSQWVSQKEYTDDLVRNTDVVSDDLLISLFNYWDYFFAAILLYFLISVIINNKRVKESVKIQKEAVQDMQKSIVSQNEAIELHKETNEILGHMLEELKQRR
jgi:hypothetical protein